MFLLEILVALGLVQLWSGSNPLHHDAWVVRWQAFAAKLPLIGAHPLALGALVVWGSVLLLGALLSAVPGVMAFLMGTVVLLYGLGRGEFADEVAPYNTACNEGDWERAAKSASRQGVDVDPVPLNQWSALHEKMLEATAYQGFERLFAVLFWFVVLGPMGALLYRLSYLYHRAQPSDVSAQWLWALEWLPARVLGASFAITGNFVGCINRWRETLFSQSAPTATVLLQSVLGALSVDDELMESCDVTQREVNAIKRLYWRTLWLWVALLALWVLIGPGPLWL